MGIELKVLPPDLIAGSAPGIDVFTDGLTD